MRAESHGESSVVHNTVALAPNPGAWLGATELASLTRAVQSTQIVYCCQTLGDLQIKRPGFRFKSWPGPALGCKSRRLLPAWVLSVCSDECLPLGALAGKRLFSQCLWFPWYKYPHHRWSRATDVIVLNRLVKKYTKSTLPDSSCGQHTTLTWYVLMLSNTLRSLAHLRCIWLPLLPYTRSHRGPSQNTASESFTQPGTALKVYMGISSLTCP